MQYSIYISSSHASPKAVFSVLVCASSCKDFGWLSLWGQGTTKICFSSKCGSRDHKEKERILDSRIASRPENAIFPLLLVSLETSHTDTWHSSAVNFSEVKFHWFESFLFVTGECKTGQRRLTGECFLLTAVELYQRGHTSGSFYYHPAWWNNTDSVRHALSLSFALAVVVWNCVWWAWLPY